ncbi:peptide ABC transporter permease [Thermococcus profundus]|uniref:Peptide ABC transporter permease n=1 Tax=Thermococcus profundus TaxID=49899 RepID=A0A2Z2MBI8_THEPR|nr:ABC transporter permease subunit [Thermococcus profundus]ASJ01915.1 peptide ABC transporter permease [Thermococcus profundus]
MSKPPGIPWKIKAAVAIVLFYTLASIIGPYTLKGEDIKNWGNLAYWDKNPRGMPPEWYGRLKNLPPSGWMEGRYLNGSYVFTYDFHYRSAPKDIVVFINTTKSIEIELKTPLNESFLLFKGSPSLQNYVVHLGRNYLTLEKITAERCRTNMRGQSLFEKTILNAVFSKPVKECITDPEPVYGKYEIKVKAEDSPLTRIIYGGTPSLNPNETVRIFIAGKSYGYLGTDTLGRDVWVGFIGGMRETLVIALEAALISVGLGLILGTLGGISGKLGDGINLISRFLTVLPVLPLAMASVVWLGRVSLENNTYMIKINSLLVSLIIGTLLAGNVSRNIRAIVKEELRKGYAESSKALGGTLVWIIRKHVSRVLIPYSLEQLALAVPGVVAFLTLLGFFNILPGFNWSGLMSQTIVYNAEYQFLWWQVLPIGVSIGLLALAFVAIANWIEEEFIKI